MVTLDFYSAVSVFLALGIASVLGMWVAWREQKSRELTLDKRYIWYCSVCTYTYINTKEDSFSLCPRCGSYNKREAQGV